jgi:hypothetical protein
MSAVKPKKGAHDPKAWGKLNSGDVTPAVATLAAKGGTLDFEAADVLQDMLTKAHAQKLSAVKKGMVFAFGTYQVVKTVATVSKLAVVNVPVKFKTNCYESSFLPMDTGTALTPLLVRQSMAPCASCCGSYAGWAALRNTTIVVAFDTGHNGSGDDGTFIFSSSGSCFQSG